MPARITRFCFVLLAILIIGLVPGLLRADEITEPRFLLAWGRRGDQPGEFYSPIGIAVSRQDEVYVTDLNNARVQKFADDGKHLGGFDLPWDDPKRRSSQAGGIAVDASGQIYLSFMQQHVVRVYTEDGKIVREWGRKGSADGEFHQPGGIVFGPDNTLFVADQCNHRVQKFTTDGKFVGKWGEHGKALGQFDGTDPPGSRFGGPHFIARDSHGRLYTTEGMLGRVQQFSPEGKPLLGWGNKGDEPGGFGSYSFANGKMSLGPIAIAVDRYDRVLVSSLNDRVQYFTSDGKYLFGIGGTGDEPGEFIHPHGLAFDSQGHLYVADAGNQRIQKFAIPKP
jgi:sugar lactone lactonase YvrE